MKLISDLATTHARTLRDTKHQKLPALTVVLHITGRQTWLHAEQQRKPPLTLLSEYFSKKGNPFAHYSIDPWGRIACHADEEHTPWAQGWAAYGGKTGLTAKLASGRIKVPAWWLEAWKGLDYTSPLDLLQPGQETPNDRSVAIECIQWGNQLKLTTAQYTVGSALLTDICDRHAIVKGFPYVRGHEDCDPWGRGTSDGGGWDPGSSALPDATFSWAAMFATRSLDLCPEVIPTPDMPDWCVMP